MIANPIGTPAMICGHGLILGELVQANQNRPAGKAMLPRPITSRRVSMGLPFAGSGANRVLVVKASKAHPRSTPTSMLMNGKLATPGLMPLVSANEIG